MKTLQEIIERNDYKRMSSEMCNRVEELAEIVINKMLELEIDDLDDLIIRKKSSGGFENYYLYIDNGYEGRSGALNVCKNSDYGKGRDGFYYAGDFNKWVNFASNSDALYFLNRAQHYIDLLDKIESKKCEEIKKVL